MMAATAMNSALGNLVSRIWHDSICSNSKGFMVEFRRVKLVQKNMVDTKS